MCKLTVVPDGLDWIIARYGLPGTPSGKTFKPDRDWVAENIRSFALPFSIRQSWDQAEIRSFWAHRLVGAAMIDAIEEIHDFYGLAYMRKHRLDQWGGVYNPRFKRGSTKEPSAHAWGIAIDWCPEMAPYGERTRMPWPIVEAFLRRGFENLPVTDGMHFQACIGY